MRKRQLTLLVNVTQKDIDDGGDQPCSCPVALAGTRALAEAGFEEYRVEWEPYRAFCEPEGFTVWPERWRPDGGDPVCRVPVEKVPYEVYEFASMFDDWFRAEDGVDQDGEPYECPAPFSFKLKLRLPAA